MTEPYDFEKEQRLIEMRMEEWYRHPHKMKGYREDDKLDVQHNYIDSLNRNEDNRE